MKIQVGGLSEGVHPYSFTATPAELGVEADFAEDIAVEATLEKSNGEFLLRATVATNANWQCDRCVAQYRNPIAAGYQMYYIWEGGDGARFDPAEVQVIPPGSNMIDIGEDVRQTLLLSVPLKRVCREDCKGLCPHCGKNLNEGTCGCTVTLPDGRWDKLKDLQIKTKHDVR